MIITYGEDQQRYPHPDHIRVHDITVPRSNAAGDPDWYPEPGEPWQPLKLYYSRGFSRRRLHGDARVVTEQGEESPFKDWLSKIADDHDAKVTTRIDVGDHIEIAPGRAAGAPHPGRPRRVLVQGADRRGAATATRGRSTTSPEPAGQGEPDDEGFETDLFGGL